MALLVLEHSVFAYRVDFALNAAAVVLMALFLGFTVAPQDGYWMVILALIGLASWSAIEYLLHRFVFHGLQPFRKWHALHHQRPTALIFTPTLLSALVIAGLVFVPALLLGNVWTACAFTLGVQTGNLGYSIIHHGIHHWRADSAWLKRRKLWHAVHHRGTTARHCFGVTTSFWDHVFRSAPPARERAGD